MLSRWYTKESIRSWSVVRAIRSVSESTSRSGTLVGDSSASRTGSRFKEEDVGANEQGLTTAEDPDRVDIPRADIFGDESGNEVQYQTMSWYHVGFLCIAETVSLGILSLPSVMATVGFLPGIFLIAGIGLLCTYTGFVIGQFKQRHPKIHSFADAGLLIAGPVGEWIVEIGQNLILIFIMAAHVLTFTIMMNVLTHHATCSLVFGVVALVLSFILTLPRTLKNMSYISVFSCASITAAIIITMIGVGIKAPGVGTTYVIVPSQMTSFSKASLACGEIVIAFTGHATFFGFISELKQPADFPKSLALLQTVAISFYVTVGVVIYYYAGAAVASPALGSASETVRNIAYGIASPTIVIAGVINAHVSVKNIYVRIWRGSTVMSERTFRAIGSWVGICAAVWTVAWVIASAIPVFNQLLGLMGAMFCTWFSLGLPAIFWLHMNSGLYGKDWKKRSLFVLNVFILLTCIAICVLGTYGSIKAISENTGPMRAFACADNAGTVESTD